MIKNDGLKVEIIISGGRADLNVKAKKHRAAELKHENWHEHRQLLEALITVWYSNSLLEILLLFLSKSNCVCLISNFPLSLIPCLWYLQIQATSHVFILIYELVYLRLSANLQIGGTVHTDWKSNALPVHTIPCVN